MKTTFKYRFISFILLATMLHVSVGCHYYKVNTFNDAQVGVSNISSDKYVIIHFQNDYFHLSNIYIDKERNIISGTKSYKISEEHVGHNSPNPRTNRYHKKEESPTTEAHIYVNAFEVNDSSGKDEITINISDIEKLDIYDEEVGATIATYTFAAIGGVVVVLGIILLIALLTKSSCPFIYIHDGEKYVFYGETFGGAIAKNLERDDYLYLSHFQPKDGEYLLKITNELMERQYTDLAELMIVEHKPSSLVIPSQTGELYEFSNLISPLSAFSDNGTDVTTLTTSNDSVYYQFMDEQSESPDFSRLTLSFDNSSLSNEGKLLLTLKNSMWLDYVTERYFAQFGSYYEKFREERENVPAEEKIKWAKEQGMFLKVEQLTTNGWEEIDQLTPIGPLAPRTLALPLSNLKNSKEIQIRLSCGLHFWELDQIALDLSEVKPLDSKTIQVNSAIDGAGTDVKNSLTVSDNNYLAQPNIGDEAFLSFQTLEKKNPENTQSVILHTRGYYEYIRTYTGKPNRKKLLKFKEPNSFPRFAKEMLTEFAEK